MRVCFIKHAWDCMFILLRNFGALHSLDSNMHAFDLVRKW